mgnify:CR=1 FL=1
MVLLDAIRELMLSLGPLGIFVGMFLESSILPIPSEAVLVAAGLLGFSIVDITIFGGLGSTTGAIVGYYIGLYGGRPFLNKYGKYFLVTSDKLKFVEIWFKKWGAYSVLVSRLIPFIPYKVFSIASGIGKIKFSTFVIFTLIGSIPRSFILGYFGSLLYTTQNIIIMAFAIILAIVIPIVILKFWKK